MGRKTVFLLLALALVALSLAGCGSDDSCAVANDGGNPDIWFTYVPPYGSYDHLEGSVSNVRPQDYKVAVYIKVGGWWTKPYWSDPKTDIDKCGNFSTDITTGGSDQYATEIRAYLIPADYDPPLARGYYYIPEEIGDNAVDVAIAKR